MATAGLLLFKGGCGGPCIERSEPKQGVGCRGGGGGANALLGVGVGFKYVVVITVRYRNRTDFRPAKWAGQTSGRTFWAKIARYRSKPDIRPANRPSC